MNGKYLLDTNIVIALFNRDAEVEARLAQALEVFLSSIVLGELHFGAAKSGQPEANALRIEEFASSCTLIEIDPGTAREYGLIKSRLKKKGRPIPENDIWIAACASLHGLSLATRDRHFGHVETIQIESW